MSEVIEKALSRIDIGPDELRAQLAEEPLSKVVRRSTWGSHEMAEFSDFEQALVKGTLKVEAYRELLAQTLPIYVALEKADRVLADHPEVSKVIFPILDCSDRVERDLVHFYGPDWREQTELMPITQEYVARIEQVVRDEPIRYVAHHYTRYLADLSGGVHIDRAITNAYGLDKAGHEVYDFSDIGDVNEFKVGYRKALDSLDVSIDDKVALLEEALIAYEYNIETIRALSDVYAPFAASAPAPA